MAYYFGDAISEIKLIKGTSDGHLDMTTLPTFAKKKVSRTQSVTTKDKDGKDQTTQIIVEQDERDLGAMLSMLTVAVQQLTERIEKLEAK